LLPLPMSYVRCLARNLSRGFSFFFTFFSFFLLSCNSKWPHREECRCGEFQILLF
jgi:hypothetical protein